MTRKPATAIHSLDDLLNARATKTHTQLHATGQVLYDDRVMGLHVARRTEWWRALRDLWRFIESLVAIALIAGFGYIINLLLGLFLQ